MGEEDGSKCHEGTRVSLRRAHVYNGACKEGSLGDERGGAETNEKGRLEHADGEETACPKRWARALQTREGTNDNPEGDRPPTKNKPTDNEILDLTLF